MIYVSEGGEELLPYIRADIEPGRWPFEWWFEVHVWLPNYEIGGKVVPCWSHAYKYDGGGFGLWRVWRMARQAVNKAWTEEAKNLPV